MAPFAATVAELAEQLGGRQDGRARRLPVRRAAHAPAAPVGDVALERRSLAELPFRTNSVDVPAGVAAVLEHAFHGRGIAALGIWAQVPHYVATMAYPAATVALLDGLTTATGVSVDAAELRREAVLQRERLDELVAGNDEHQAMVAQFEWLYDAAERGERPTTPSGRPTAAAELPTGDELGAEFERFLRDQGKS